MKFTASAIIASFFALSRAAPTAPAVGPDPSLVYVTHINYGGSGCPVGSIAQSFSGDRTYFTLIFDQFIASMGPGIPGTESRKNCQINVGIRYPGGYQFSIFEATYRGFADLPKTQTGTQKATYYFSGDNRQCSAESIIKGPISRDYVFTDKISTETNVWSPCGVEGLLNINSQVRITSTQNPPKEQGQLTTDSLDGKFQQIMALNWRKC
ncbi:hypothetical protein TWF696_009158 [Orbilia brochopaga]|uniref:Secreted protein n=1 Tax=Orbilia brochopaga TaxID=3140254 RepID=A0AAV9UFW8_9PEZI